MAAKEKKEVSASPIDGLIEANQALVESLSAAQERNLKYAQRVFESTMELLRNHMEGTLALLEQWEQQARKQQGIPRTSESYLDLFRVPLIAYQQTLEVMATASRQSLESFRRATESFQQAMQRGQEQWQEAVRQAQHTTGKPKE
jgi:hypothetical protein